MASFELKIGFSLTSLMSGFIIFSVLGHISVMVGQDITELATQGPELVFVAYPQALSEMMPPALWSTMFFFCLFVLGIDSVFSSVECCNNALEDILHNQGYKGMSPTRSRQTNQFQIRVRANSI